MIKNKLFLQMIADLLKIEIMVPEIEEMSLYGAAALWNTATKEYF